jgi:NAD(P)-dependent dehydrogenase (short-subunit alcohol dehydrogenase family)
MLEARVTRRSERRRGGLMASRFPSRPRAVVTGAASGFGRAVAIELASRGSRLVLSDVDLEGLEETASRAKAAGGEVRTLRCDVRDAEQVEAQAKLADEAFGGTDIAINNAGVAVAGPVGDVPLDDWRWQIDINLYGVIYGCHSFVPRMKAARRGWIMNVASSAGLLSAPMMGPYNVTKAGVVALTETLYGELRGSGVEVSALCPTFFRTNIHTTARSPNGMGAATEKLVTQARWSAEEIAKVALDGLERGELYVVPQLDGKVLWRAKRLLGQRFHGVVGRVVKSQRARFGGQ